MSDYVLIIDPSEILNSERIQIIHKHPDFAHKKRTDLDPWEFVATSYPIALANKIIPFLDLPASPVAVKRARTKSPKRPESASPARRTRSTNVETDKRRTRSPRKRSPAKSSTVDDAATNTTTPQKPTLINLPMPYFTPARPQPLPTATPGTVDTVQTSRTISPGGTLLSPLNLFSTNDLWSPLPPLKTKHPSANTTTIPRTLFPPAKVPPLHQTQVPLPPFTLPTQPPITVPSQRSRLLTFTPTPTILAHGISLPTLTLRHDLSTSALCDVFTWCHASVIAGRIINPKGWLIHFRDTSRVREINEVCREFGLNSMAKKTEELLGELERGFGGWEMDDLVSEEVQSDEDEEEESGSSGDGVEEVETMDKED